MQTETNYTIIKLAGEFVTLLNRLLKTITYNVLVFIVGLAVGYIIVASKVHYYATQHDNYEYIKRLEKTIKEVETLDKSYTQKQQDVYDILKEIEMKLSHEKHADCKTTIGKILLKSSN